MQTGRVELQLRSEMRRELDRLAGEILRRHHETEECLMLYARREALRNLYLQPPLPATLSVRLDAFDQWAATA